MQTALQLIDNELSIDDDFYASKTLDIVDQEVERLIFGLTEMLEEIPEDETLVF